MPRQERILKSEFQGVGKLLKDNRFAVPAYQRDFSWDKDEISLLWEDIIGAFNGTPSDSFQYFLGSIVVNQSGSNGVLQIIDGQQRIAAISMLLSSISKYWAERSFVDESSSVKDIFLMKKDLRKNINPSLKLNEDNSSTFEKVVLKHDKLTSADIKSLSKSNRLIFDAMALFDTKLTEWINGISDKNEILIQLVEYITDDLKVNLIYVNDEADAYALFETMNDRGLDLATSDLVKNYLFSLAGPDIELFKQFWNSIKSKLDSEDFTRFLRHVWLSSYEYVNDKDLYRKLKASVNTRVKAKQFLELLNECIDCLSALNNINDPFWNSHQKEYRDFVEAMQLFGIVITRPLLFAVMKKFKPAHQIEIFKMLVVISFRYTIIGNLSPTELEKLYCEVAVGVKNGCIAKPNLVYNKIKKFNIDDAAFKAAFEKYKTTKNRLAVYILKTIEDSKWPSGEIEVNIDKISLEHILPRKYQAHWSSFNTQGADIDEFIYSIGNLTLLEIKTNNEIKNSVFSNKQTKAFSISKLKMNLKINKQKTWEASSITRRAKILSKDAAILWKYS